MQAFESNMIQSGPVLVAGHLCLDFTPALEAEALPRPGGSTAAGGLCVSLGGAVGNVGSALWRLGCPVRLVALVGNDFLSEVCFGLLRPLSEQPGIRKAPGENTSYSIVIAPPGLDRAFLHCTGVNAVFKSADVRDEDLDGCRWLHFGYPPVMPAMADEDGRELADLYRRASLRGLRTSLDFCSIGTSAAKAVNWKALLGNCAQHVMLFAPSAEELCDALEEPQLPAGDVAGVRCLAAMLLNMGFTLVAIKLGKCGLYLATTRDTAQITRWGLRSDWAGRELMAPCFESRFVNANGAGDCTIAGLISSIEDGATPEDAITDAVVVGASSTEAADASSGVQGIRELHARMNNGWPRMKCYDPGPEWSWYEAESLWKIRSCTGIRAESERGYATH